MLADSRTGSRSSAPQQRTLAQLARWPAPAQVPSPPVPHQPLRLEEEPALLLGDRPAEPLEDQQHVFPDLALLRDCLVPQQVRWMEGDHQRDALELQPL